MICGMKDNNLGNMPSIGDLINIKDSSNLNIIGELGGGCSSTVNLGSGSLLGSFGVVDFCLN